MPSQLKNARQHDQDLAETARPFPLTPKNPFSAALGALVAAVIAIAAGDFRVGAVLAAALSLVPLWRALLAEPALRGAWLGALAGFVAGAGSHLAPAAGARPAPGALPELGVFALVGVVIGGSVGSYPSDKRFPSPQTMIKGAGASFALVFAIAVTWRFYFAGLKLAGDLAAALSTLLTVVLVTFFVPMWAVDQAFGAVRRMAEKRRYPRAAV